MQHATLHYFLKILLRISFASQQLLKLPALYHHPLSLFLPCVFLRKAIYHCQRFIPTHQTCPVRT